MERRETHARRHLPICVQHSSRAQGETTGTDGFLCTTSHGARMALLQAHSFHSSPGTDVRQHAAGSGGKMDGRVDLDGCAGGDCEQNVEHTDRLEALPGEPVQHSHLEGLVKLGRACAMMMMQNGGPGRIGAPWRGQRILERTTGQRQRETWVPGCQRGSPKRVRRRRPDQVSANEAPDGVHWGRCAARWTQCWSNFRERASACA